MRISAIYNGCNCAVSSFNANSEPTNLDLEASVNNPTTQVFGYQGNFISDTFRQSCGDYTVTLTPVLDFVSLEGSGTLSPVTNSPLIDVLRVEATTEHIG